MTIKTIGYIEFKGDTIGDPEAAISRPELMEMANAVLEKLQNQAASTHTSVEPFGVHSETTHTGATIFTVYVRGDLPDLQDRIDALTTQYATT